MSGVGLDVLGRLVHGTRRILVFWGEGWAGLGFGRIGTRTLFLIWYIPRGSGPLDPLSPMFITENTSVPLDGELYGFGKSSSRSDVNGSYLTHSSKTLFSTVFMESFH